jgi:hypothetical protein
MFLLTAVTACIYLSRYGLRPWMLPGSGLPLALGPTMWPFCMVGLPLRAAPGSYGMAVTLNELVRPGALTGAFTSTGVGVPSELVPHLGRGHSPTLCPFWRSRAWARRGFRIFSIPLNWHQPLANAANLQDVMFLVCWGWSLGRWGYLPKGLSLLYVGACRAGPHWPSSHPGCPWACLPTNVFAFRAL